jgi:hypothetical protein
MRVGRYAVVAQPTPSEVAQLKRELRDLKALLPELCRDAYEEGQGHPFESRDNYGYESSHNCRVLVRAALGQEVDK